MPPESTVPSERRDPDAFIVTVTPDMARQMLANRAPNRPINNARVAEFTRIIIAGEFRLSNDAIAFDTSARLLNGQHRLMACVLSGQPIVCLVLHAIPQENFRIMDRGSRRTLNQVLTCEFPDTDLRKMSGVINVMRWAPVAYNRLRQMTPDQACAFVQSYGDSLRFVTSMFGKEHQRVATSAPVRAAIARAYYHVEAQTVSRFCEILLTRNGAIPNGPAENAPLMLASWASKVGSRRVAAHAGQSQIYQHAQNAIRHFVSGTPVNLPRPIPGDIYPLPYRGLDFANVAFQDLETEPNG